MGTIRGKPYAFGRAMGSLQLDPTAVTDDAIMLLHPPQLAEFRNRCRQSQCCPAGIIVVNGAPLSHPMIGLLGLERPVVIIQAGDVDRLGQARIVVLDGGRGTIMDAKEAAIAVAETAPPPAAGESVFTADNQAVRLYASIGNVDAANLAVQRGAAAIGLFRSEFLQPSGGRQPDVEYYLDAFGAVCQAAHPLVVTVRLVDISPDKLPAWLPRDLHPGAPLRMQGSRLYAIEPVRSVFQAEIVALGQLARRYPSRILLPYISQIEELRRWCREIETLLPLPLPIGTMAETPAAILTLRELLDEADFVAIGCNDMMQCLFAADRDSDAVSYLLDPYQTAPLRLLNLAAQWAGADIDRVQLCGLLPQVPSILPVLLGMGYRTFSVEPRQIPYLAQTVGTTDTAVAAKLAAAVCAARDAAEVGALLDIAPPAS